jgi:hypothetical protein
MQRSAMLSMIGRSLGYDSLTVAELRQLVLDRIGATLSEKEKRKL